MKKLHMAYIDSMHQSNHQPPELLIPYRPALFCLNDDEISTDEDRARAARFLEIRFPVKSPFEREG